MHISAELIDNKWLYTEDKNLSGINEHCFETKKISDDIWIIDDHKSVISYLVCGSKKCLLVDTGWGIGNLVEIITSITNLQIVVVNTHVHPDHAGGDYLFQEVYIATEDMKLLDSCFSKKNRSDMIRHFSGKGLPAGFSKDAWINASFDDIPTKILPLKNGDIFDLGGRIIEAIALPGHTAGCIALIDSASGILFSGDTVISGEVWLHLEESMPLSIYLNSLKYLDSISGKFEQIFSGHGKNPVDKKIIRSLIFCVENILDGKIAGKPYKTFAGKGLRIRYEDFALIYNNGNL